MEEMKNIVTIDEMAGSLLWQEIEKHKPNKINESADDNDIDETDNEEVIMDSDPSKEILFNNLDDIDNYLKGKKLPVGELKKINPSDGNSYDLAVSLFFVGNKNVKTVGNDRYRSYYFKVDENSNSVIDVKAFKSDKRQSDVEEFIGTYDTANRKEIGVVSLKYILNHTNCKSIYNTYIRTVKREMQQLSLGALYKLFTGGLLFEVESEKGTLSVGYSSIIGRYVYTYNPRFILSLALEEYGAKPHSYGSLMDCYVYNLLFVISHEMMHIVTNNVVNGGLNTYIDADDGKSRIDNTVTDSYINCSLANLMSSSKHLTNEGRIKKEKPLNCIGEEVQIRAEHNVGFKKYKSDTDFVNEISQIITDYYKTESAKGKSFRTEIDFNGEDFSRFAGADVLVSISVNGDCVGLRMNTNLFQKLINGIAKTITNGIVTDIVQEYTTAEQVSDDNVIPNGTLVRVCNAVPMVICYVKGSKKYNLGKQESIYYTLTKAEAVGDEDVTLSDGTQAKRTKYRDTGELYDKAPNGEVDGSLVIVVDDSENVWIPATSDEGNGLLTAKEKQEAGNKPSNIIELAYNLKMNVRELLQMIYEVIENVGADIADDRANKALRDCNGKDNDGCRQVLGEEIYNEFYKKVYDVYSEEQERMSKALQGLTGGLGGLGGGLGGFMPQPKEIKKFAKGDIVYIRDKGVYGRIVDIKNGLFEVERMKEEAPTVVDKNF